MPRPAGQPIQLPSATKSSSKEIPCITSGITSGALIIALYKAKPRKRPIRASTKPPQVPSAAEANAVIIAMRNDSQAASSSSWSWKSALYHFSENRVHTVTSCDSLNEYAIRLMIGAWRKKKPMPNAVRRSERFGLIIALAPVQFLSLRVLKYSHWRQQQQRHCAGYRGRHWPVRIIKELIPHHSANHQRIRAAEQFRNHIFANRRDKDEQTAGNHAVF